MHTKSTIIKHHQHGFTLIEITVVLVLMAIIAAYVIGRSVTTEQVDVVGLSDRIRNQIRYAQSAAMKQSHRIWGVKCDTGASQYWLFSVESPVSAGDENQAGNQRRFPGENNDVISFADLELDNLSPSFILFFDRIGKPYLNSYTDENTNSPLLNDFVITVSAGGEARTITVIPETGMVQ
ncbi:MAG: prepilin-type N-terminal cleavage/methylation domain-containing protein [Desulfobacterales bacterium]|jgi:prepilin-type N-terminal cleavage/methylation domain-containing protein